MSATKRQYQSLVSDHKKRRERNIRLLAKLENIEKKAAFLQAKTDRIKSLKVIYRNQVQSPPVLADIQNTTYRPKTACIITERVPLETPRSDYDYYRPYSSQYSQHRNERVYMDPKPLYTYRNITLDDAIEEISRRFILVPKTTQETQRQHEEPKIDNSYQPPRETLDEYNYYDKNYDANKNDSDCSESNINDQTHTTNDHDKPKINNESEPNISNEVSATNFDNNNINNYEDPYFEKGNVEQSENDKSNDFSDMKITSDANESLAENMKPDLQNDETLSEAIIQPEEIIHTSETTRKSAPFTLINNASLDVPDSQNSQEFEDNTLSNLPSNETEEKHEPGAELHTEKYETNDPNIQPVADENQALTGDPNVAAPIDNSTGEIYDSSQHTEGGQYDNEYENYHGQNKEKNNTADQYSSDNYQEYAPQDDTQQVQADQQNFTDEGQPTQQVEYDPNQQYYYEGQENAEVDPNQQYEYNQEYENQGNEHHEGDVNYTEESQVYNENTENTNYQEGGEPQDYPYTGDVPREVAYDVTQSYAETGNEHQYESETVPLNENYDQQDTTYDNTATLGDQINDHATDEAITEAQPLKILESDTEHDTSNREEQSKQESDFDFSVAQ